MKINDNVVIFQTDDFTVRYPKSWVKFFIVMSVLTGGLLATSIVFRNETSHWLVYLLFSFLFFGTVRFTMELARWKLVVGKETITIHNWRGKIKTIISDDITSIKKGASGYKVYVNEKRVFSVSNVSETKGLIKFIRRYDNKMKSTLTLEAFQKINGKSVVPGQVICSIRLPTGHLIVGVGCTILVVATIILVNSIEVEGTFLEFLLLNFMFGLGAIYMVYYAIRCFIWRINVDSTTLTIRNSLGRERAYLIVDITKVLIRKGYINIYVKEKKVVKFDIVCSNIETFLKIIISSLGEEIIVEENSIFRL